ncbi:MAG: ABC transporter substrate-binding protein [Rhodobacteraceae bacterium]|nr:MAG: ABC transporter substrate-binding protein [Paracoccaceae bacterium]
MNNSFKMNRRRLLQGGTAALATPMILKASRASAQSATFKIGYVSPQTGPLAGFGEADDFIIKGAKAAFAGLENNGKPVNVEIIVKDAQSNSNRAAEVTASLIERDGVNLVLGAGGGADMTNPVADQCELNEVPCLTTVAPWQPYFFGRNGNPATGFDYSYHFFWGLEDVIENFINLWDGTGVSKNVAGLFPNDADGNAWGDPELGFPKPLAAAGYDLVDPGRYQVMNNDFSSQIAAYKAAGCEIVAGNMIPPDFATFWGQAAQQGFKPRVVTVAKALLFPSVIESLGDRGDGLTSEIWWTPNHPFSSSLTGQSAKELAEGYTAETGRTWTQPIGFAHALFELAGDIVKRTDALDDNEAVLAALTSTDLDTVVGPVNWKNGPVKNVHRTPLVSGQWRVEDGKPNLVITDNKAYPKIPVGGETKLIG